MTFTMRVSNPGYNALTDTNIDHYSLYGDSDNVLIKEFTRGGTTIAGLGTGTVPYTIVHNLNYIPLFYTYVLDKDFGVNNKWKLVPHTQSALSVPPYYAYSNTGTVSIFNFWSASTASTNFKWYIFYDNISGTAGTASMNGQVIRMSKQGVNALTSTNPNDYLFVSTLNTFKILAEGTASLTYTADGTYTFNHGATISNPTAHNLFVKFPDGYTEMTCGVGDIFSRDNAFTVSDTYLDTTKFGVRLTRNSGVQTVLNFKYYIFETPLS